MASAFPWASMAVFAPLLGALLAVLVPRRGAGVGAGVAAAVVVASLGLTGAVLADGPQRLAVGGWGAPLGIDLLADGLAAAMLLMTAAVGTAVTTYAPAYFRATPAAGTSFWPLWLFLWAALNALFLSADLFNLYVTLELVGLAAVALVALAGGALALGAAMRYLLVTLAGSLAYLLGVALLYHLHGGVDIALVAAAPVAGPAAAAALGAIVVGLLLKAALFPLHFWLPPAHAGAPAPVSALLSALVAKAAFYLLLRLWLAFPEGLGPALAQLLGWLGAAAVLWGSWQALRQVRLKLLVAYSTVAQIGYLFIAFPLVAAGAAAWGGVVYLALAHALAKAAMFMAAGNLLRYGEHDRIADLDQAVHRLPLTMSAFALGGVSIMGLPPSGGFVGKWLLLEAAFGLGRWDLAAVMLIGGLLAAAYVFKVLGYAFTPADAPHSERPIPAAMEWPALALAGGAIGLGFAWPAVDVLLSAGEAP